MGGNYDLKILMQDLVFPEGVVLDTKNRQYLTKNINLIFSLILDLSWLTEGNKKRLKGNLSDESLLVGLSVVSSNLIIEDLMIIIYLMTNNQFTQ